MALTIEEDLYSRLQTDTAVTALFDTRTYWNSVPHAETPLPWAYLAITQQQPVNGTATRQLCQCTVTVDILAGTYASMRECADTVMTSLNGFSGGQIVRCLWADTATELTADDGFHAVVSFTVTHDANAVIAVSSGLPRVEVRSDGLYVGGVKVSGAKGDKGDKGDTGSQGPPGTTPDLSDYPGEITAVGFQVNDQGNVTIMDANGFAGDGSRLTGLPLSNYARKDAANVFTQQQTIQKFNPGGMGGELRLSNDGGHPNNATALIFDDGGTDDTSGSVRAAITSTSVAPTYGGRLDMKTGIGHLADLPARLSIGNNGAVSVGATQEASVVPLTVIAGTGGQTADLQQWTAGPVVAAIHVNGGFEGGPLRANYDNSDYTNTGGTNSHILMNNPNATGQTVVSSVINGSVVAKWRTDYVGNISWVAGPTGAHDFYVGGDHPTGRIGFIVNNDGTAEAPNGLVLKSPSGTRYKLVVANDGTLSTTPA